MSPSATKQQAKPPSAVIGAPALPQVNLLPPEVRAARGLVHLKRWLLVIVGLVLVLIAAVWALAVVARTAAEGMLADEQAKTVLLQAEVGKYAEVPKVLNQLDQAQKARTFGMSTEVLWKGYVDAVTAVLPPNVSIDGYAVTSSTPWAAAVTAQDPLSMPGVATIAFTGRSRTLPDDAAWMDALDTIPNVSNPTIASASLAQEDGEPYYAVSISVTVDTTATANRFPATTNEVG